MTEQELFRAKDPDLRRSLDAALAREQALQTDTAIVVLKDQKIVRLTADDIRKEDKA